MDISDGAEVTEPRRPVKRLVVELEFVGLARPAGILDGLPVKGDGDGHQPDG